MPKWAFGLSTQAMTECVMYVFFLQHVPCMFQFWIVPSTIFQIEAGPLFNYSVAYYAEKIEANIATHGIATHSTITCFLYMMIITI
jgi:hypothetical protein